MSAHGREHGAETAAAFLQGTRSCCAAAGVREDFGIVGASAFGFTHETVLATDDAYGLSGRELNSRFALADRRGNGVQGDLQAFVRVARTLSATSRDREAVCQAIQGAGTGADGVFDIAFSNVITDANVHGLCNRDT